MDKGLTFLIIKIILEIKDFQNLIDVSKGRDNFFSVLRIDPVVLYQNIAASRTIQAGEQEISMMNHNLLILKMAITIFRIPHPVLMLVIHQWNMMTNAFPQEKEPFDVIWVVMGGH